MDTTSIGINYGNEDFFVTLIIIIIAIIFIYILLRVSRKDNKPDQAVINENSKNEHDVEEDVVPELNNKHSDGLCVDQVIISSVKEKSVITPIPILKPENTKPEENPVRSLPKYIGYKPVNVFAQTEPLHYPYVVMPSRPECPIKFPQKGRSGRKGYKENDFLLFMQRYFKDTFNIYDDRCVLTKANRYEPDFSLLNEKNGVNIFLDIEIDEPYEGINDINTRRATHFQLSDVNRNNEFKNRGWIVIRFAEIQIHQNPDGCCRFIADVIKSIYPQFVIPHELMSVKRIEAVQQWTKELALFWSKQKYREEYLGINQFGYMPETIETNITVIQDENVEDEVIDDRIIIVPEKNEHTISEQNIINEAIQSDKYVAFLYEWKKHIIKPSKCNGCIVTGYCYVKNMVLDFEICKIKDLCLKDDYCTISLSADKLGIKNVANIMNIIIPNKKYVRMEYTRREWNGIYINPETGELINNKTEAETSIRTISGIQLDTEGWGENYIRAYCHKRDADRTFYFARISLLEILDL